MSRQKLTLAEQETIILWDNELDTAEVYTHDARLINKLRELSQRFPEDYVLERSGPGRSVTYRIPKAQAGGKEYGALSLAVQYYAEAEIVANVPPNCFMPRPKVGSAVIRLMRHETPVVQTEDEKLMFRLIRASFNQRRKTLANGLANSGVFPLTKERIQECIKELGVSETVRGETLSLEQFARLSDLFKRELP